MRTLEFVVDRQQIRKKTDCDFSGIVAGSKGYLQAKFFFSEDWDDCKKAASFWVRDMMTLSHAEHAVRLDENNTCVIPNEALVDNEFYVSVTGVKDNGKYTIPTNKTKVQQEVL